MLAHKMDFVNSRKSMAVEKGVPLSKIKRHCNTTEKKCSVFVPLISHGKYQIEKF
jgi:hypothetical protein